MNRNRHAIIRLWVLAFCGTIVAPAIDGAEQEKYLGPGAIAASRDGTVAYVAHADAKQVAWVDLSNGKVIRLLDMPAVPTGLVPSPDGSKLYVACAAPRSTVVVLEAASGEIVASIPAGHTATGAAISPDASRLYVCNRFDNDVSVIDLMAGREIARVGVTREPVAAAVTPDGRLVVVANHLPRDRTDLFYSTASVTLIDTQSHETNDVRLPNGSTGVRGVCILPDGKYAFITHILGNFELVASQVTQGWTNTNAVSVIDLHEQTLFNNALLDDNYLGSGNLWGVAVSADGRWLCVAQSGTHELSVIDAPALLEVLPTAAKTRGPMDGPSILTGIRHRIQLAGRGPRGVVVAGSKAVVAEYFSDTLAVVDLPATPDTLPRRIALGPEPRLTPRRRGEMLFHDATICFQHWQSCVSCHPDARADGLSWDLLNDGAGTPKNAKSLLLSHATPPSMATGVRPTAEAAVRAGIRHILFSERPEADAAAIDEYLKSLRPVPSPRLVDGRLSAAARRGKKLFESPQVGCNKCHPAPLYTDLLMHDVDTRSMYDFQQSKFDTPTLVEVWRTAPYLHDGRHLTMKKLIATGKHGKQRGDLDSLTEQQIDDLVEFVLSL